MKLRFILLGCLLFFAGRIRSESAISYEFSYGRFGDHLVSYSHARWLSFKQNIPLLYKPFKYSDSLAMHNLHEWYDKAEPSFKKVVTFPSKGGKVTLSNLSIKKDSNTLYVYPFFPETILDKLSKDYAYFDVHWKNPEFKAMLKREITPIVPLEYIETPPNRVSVAVHVRRGSGPDNQKKFLQSVVRSSPFLDQRYPLRFPPDSYFIDHIKNIAVLVYPAPLHVHIFTDDKNPAAIAQTYREAITQYDVTFGFRTSTKNDTVLDDFFSMMRFECIIRPESHFSLMAAHLSDAAIIIYPADYVWHNRQLKVTKSTTVINKNMFEQLKIKHNLIALKEQRGA